MAEFKNKAEYEKWKAEKAKRAKEGEVERPSKQNSTLMLSKNTVIIMAVILVVITATIVYFIAKLSPQVAKHEDVAKAVPNVSIPAPQATDAKKINYLMNPHQKIKHI